MHSILVPQEKIDEARKLFEQGMVPAHICRRIGMTQSSFTAAQKRDWQAATRAIGRTTRPVPEDFADMAKVMGRKSLREHYNTGHGQITRWLTESGIGKAAQLPRQSIAWPAEDRQAVKDDLAAGLTISEIAAKRGRTRLSIQSIAHKMCVRMTPEAVARANAEARGRLKQLRDEKRQTMRPGKTGPGVVKSFQKSYVPSIAGDPASLAADFLRRHYIGVFHLGRETPQHRDIWQVGGHRLHVNDMMALARRKGWRSMLSEAA